MKKFVKNVLMIVSSLFFPKRCAVCNKVIHFHRDYCDNCFYKIKRVPDNLNNGWCKNSSLRISKYINQYFDGYCAPFYYFDGGGAVVKNYKIGPRSELAELLVPEMRNTFLKFYFDINFDFICGVPMTKADQSKKGFNHIELLCEKLSEEIDVPLEYEVLKQTKPKLPQHDLKRNARFKNVKGIYELDKSAEVSGKTVLLIDDISTTGATINECAKILKRGGANKVYCLLATIGD